VPPPPNTTAARWKAADEDAKQKGLHREVKGGKGDSGKGKGGKGDGKGGKGEALTAAKAEQEKQAAEAQAAAAERSRKALEAMLDSALVSVRAVEAADAAAAAANGESWVPASAAERPEIDLKAVRSALAAAEKLAKGNAWATDRGNGKVRRRLWRLSSVKKQTH
jgi:hypothetical protein